MSDDNIQIYSNNADQFSKTYDQLEFENVHQDWLTHIPQQGAVLDIGAGSGRDARYLSQRGLQVVAVEPADGLRAVGEGQPSAHPIHWLADNLPELKQVYLLQFKFDLILLSAVWMHVEPSKRERCIRKLSNLLKPGGKLVVTLRYGKSPDERTMHPVSASQLVQIATRHGLKSDLLTGDFQEDQLARTDVHWKTVVLTLPDDGTGAFPLLRHVAVNDHKSSTYKLALLRSLLRIAEGHPGAVLEQDDHFVKLPLGLVSLYWLKLYKPLIDKHDMQQVSSRGVGFIKDTGWRALSGYGSSLFVIGATFTETELAKSLHQTLKDISATIKNMPVRYITLPNTDTPVFSVEQFRNKLPKDQLSLNADYMASFGTFSVPIKVWESLTRFSVWIEPVLVSEWINTMVSYEGNRVKNFTKLDFINALNWEDPERSTARIRSKVLALSIHQSLYCCWSGKKLKLDHYAIDHAFPFARWPNNDLWNLLPTDSKINANKADKLPSANRLGDAKDRILSWWEAAWINDPDEFFTQANLALPSILPKNRSYEEVFNALTIQRDRIKDFQQLQDW
jgi:SAM-dependent methyltransferase